MLFETATAAAYAFHESVNEISARALPRRIDTHDETSHERENNRKGKDRKRKTDAGSGIEREEVGR